MEKKLKIFRFVFQSNLIRPGYLTTVPCNLDLTLIFVQLRSFFSALPRQVCVIETKKKEKDLISFFLTKIK